MYDVRSEVPSEDINCLLKELRDLIQQATRLVQEKVKNSFSRELKKDNSFVTEIDLAVEDLLRNFVQTKYPSHGVLGEERPNYNADSEFQWITDPVDGTQNLVHGIPTYGIVMGLHYKGRPLVGVISHPALNLHYWAAWGCGSFCNGDRLEIKDGGVFEGEQFDIQEVIALSTRACFARSGEENYFDLIMKEHPSTRVYYDVFSTTRVIEGQIGLVVEFNMKAWDIAATEILITEAGGSYRVLRNLKNSEGPNYVSIIAGKPKMVEKAYKIFGEYKEFSI